MYNHLLCIKIFHFCSYPKPHQLSKFKMTCLLKMSLHCKETSCVCYTIIQCQIKIACLHIIVFTGGHYLSYEWCWSTVHSEGSSEVNMSTVAVIDGGTLLQCIYMVPSFPFHLHGFSLSCRCEAFTWSLMLHRDQKFSFSLYTFKPLIHNLMYTATALLVGCQRFSVLEYCHPGTLYSTAQCWQPLTQSASKFSSLETWFSILENVENQVSVFETKVLCFELRNILSLLTNWSPVICRVKMQWTSVNNYMYTGLKLKQSLSRHFATNW